MSPSTIGATVYSETVSPVYPPAISITVPPPTATTSGITYSPFQQRDVISLHYQHVPLTPDSSVSSPHLGAIEKHQLPPLDSSEHQPLYWGASGESVSDQSIHASTVASPPPTASYFHNCSYSSSPADRPLPTPPTSDDFDLKPFSSSEDYHTATILAEPSAIPRTSNLAARRLLSHQPTSTPSTPRSVFHGFPTPPSEMATVTMTASSPAAMGAFSSTSYGTHQHPQHAPHGFMSAAQESNYCQQSPQNSHQLSPRGFSSPGSYATRNRTESPPVSQQAVGLASPYHSSYSSTTPPYPAATSHVSPAGSGSTYSNYAVGGSQNQPAINTDQHQHQHQHYSPASSLPPPSHPLYYSNNHYTHMPPTSSTPTTSSMMDRSIPSITSGPSYLPAPLHPLQHHRSGYMLPGMGSSMMGSIMSHGIPHHALHQHPQQERPFRCDQCSQSFSRNHDLKRHKKIHLAVKPHPCDNCDKSFSRKDALKRHRLVKGCAKAAERKSQLAAAAASSSPSHAAMGSSISTASGSTPFTTTSPVRENPSQR
ncbi:hypothetical protein EX30DRAFT_347786 [Ascodesmis nigricans]|uniref:C2H2-type domain-containing protein n=1 Tax=Ascodesmis nigricans TaxID=341454 RepID=A0A4S2N0K2_9PEZI|nr:hypothetical protein EX30DRAFT_347786 [Ascodesmis nigricans]